MVRKDKMVGTDTLSRHLPLLNRNAMKCISELELSVPNILVFFIEESHTVFERNKYFVSKLRKTGLTYSMDKI